MQVTLLTLLAANAVFASPVYKRQSEVISEVASSVTQAAATATNPISLPVGSVTEDITAISTFTDQISSVQPEPSASASDSQDDDSDSPDSSASASASASGAADDVFSLAYPCPDGTQLIYVETQSNVNASLSLVNDAVSYFGNSTLFNVTAASGDSNVVGDTRNTSIADVIVPEVLIDFMMDNETDARFLTWNSTEAATIMDILVASYSTQSQSYTNDTLSTEEEPVSTIKVFSNICVGTEMADAAQTFLQGFFEDRVSAVATGIELASDPSTEGEDSDNPLSSVSSMVESATAPIESATSAIDSAASSATEAIGSATSSIASSAASATSAVGGMPGAAGGPLQINTPPSPTQCRPVAITFTGGQAPYFLSVLPGGEPTATPLLQFPQQDVAGTYTWNVNLAAGTRITLQVRDSTGELNFSSIVSILPSDDSSCLAVPTSA